MIGVGVTQPELRLRDLYDKVKNFEYAHRLCREINKRFDIIINVLMLVTSTIITCLESLMDLTDNDETIKILKISLAGTCATLAGLNQIFNNSEKAEKHHTTSRKYFELANNIDTSIALQEEDRYAEYSLVFKDIRKESLGLFPYARRQYSIK